MTDEMKAKRELLFSGSKNGYDRVDQQTLDAMEAYCRDYKSFLDHSKTERECTAHTVALAEAAGFIPYERGMALQPGDRVYRVNRKKSVMLAVIGRESLSEGAQIVACHIDSGLFTVIVTYFTRRPPERVSSLFATALTVPSICSPESTSVRTAVLPTGISSVSPLKNGMRISIRSSL